MVGCARLSVRTGFRFTALVALVLLTHVAVLEWLGRQFREVALLQPLATPMFTRLLQPQERASVPATPTLPRARAVRPSIASVSPNRAEAPAAAASAAVPAPKPPQETAQVEPGPAAPLATETAALPATPASAPASAAAAASTAQPGPNLDTWPADTRLSYRLSGNYRGELYGTARVQWQRVEQRYQARIEINLSVFATMVLTSQGEVTAQGLVPQVYEEVRPGGKSRGVRIGQNNIMLNDGRSLTRQPGVLLQDTASQFVELSHRFATGQELLEVGQSVQLWLARPGGMDLWTYDIVEREMLQTPGFGAIEAFHLKPRPIANPRGNITPEMWFAPSLQYLPVRIKINMGPDVYVDLMVEKIEQK